MCNSSCMSARGATCRCSCHGANHGVSRPRRGRRVGGMNRGESEDTSVPSLETAIRKIGLRVIQGVVVGVACGAIPAACPAILAISQVVGLARLASDVYDAYAKGPTRGRVLERASERVERDAL